MSFQKTLHLVWERVFPVRMIDDSVKHIFREYDQNLTTWRTWGLMGRGESQLKVSRVQKNGEQYGRCWDGSRKEVGQSGCEVVIIASGR